MDEKKALSPYSSPSHPSRLSHNNHPDKNSRDPCRRSRETTNRWLSQVQTPPSTGGASLASATTSGDVCARAPAMDGGDTSSHHIPFHPRIGSDRRGSDRSTSHQSGIRPLPSGLRGILRPAHVDLRLAGAPLIRGDGVEDPGDMAAASEPRRLACFVC